MGCLGIRILECSDCHRSCQDFGPANAMARNPLCHKLFRPESETSIHKIARSFNFNFRPRQGRHARPSWQHLPAFMLSLQRGRNPQGEPVDMRTGERQLCRMRRSARAPFVVGRLFEVGLQSSAALQRQEEFGTVEEVPGSSDRTAANAPYGPTLRLAPVGAAWPTSLALRAGRPS